MASPERAKDKVKDTECPTTFNTSKQICAFTEVRARHSTENANDAVERVIVTNTSIISWPVKCYHTSIQSPEGNEIVGSTRRLDAMPPSASPTQDIVPTPTRPNSAGCASPTSTLSLTFKMDANLPKLSNEPKKINLHTRVIFCNQHTKSTMVREDFSIDTNSPACNSPKTVQAEQSGFKSSPSFQHSTTCDPNTGFMHYNIKSNINISPGVDTQVIHGEAPAGSPVQTQSSLQPSNKVMESGVDLSRQGKSKTGVIDIELLGGNAVVCDATPQVLLDSKNMTAYSDQVIVEKATASEADIKHTVKVYNSAESEEKTENTIQAEGNENVLGEISAVGIRAGKDGGVDVVDTTDVGKDTVTADENLVAESVQDETIERSKLERVSEEVILESPEMVIPTAVDMPLSDEAFALALPADLNEVTEGEKEDGKDMDRLQIEEDGQQVADVEQPISENVEKVVVQQSETVDKAQTNIDEVEGYELPGDQLMKELEEADQITKSKGELQTDQMISPAETDIHLPLAEQEKKAAEVEGPTETATIPDAQDVPVETAPVLPSQILGESEKTPDGVELSTPPTIEMVAEEEAVEQPREPVEQALESSETKRQPTNAEEEEEKAAELEGPTEIAAIPDAQEVPVETDPTIPAELEKAPDDIELSKSPTTEKVTEEQFGAKPKESTEQAFESPETEVQPGSGEEEEKAVDVEGPSQIAPMLDAQDVPAGTILITPVESEKAPDGVEPSTAPTDEKVTEEQLVEQSEEPVEQPLKFTETEVKPATAEEKGKTGEKEEPKETASIPDAQDVPAPPSQIPAESEKTPGGVEPSTPPTAEEVIKEQTVEQPRESVGQAMESLEAQEQTLAVEEEEEGKVDDGLDNTEVIPVSVDPEIIPTTAPPPEPVQVLVQLDEQNSRVLLDETIAGLQEVDDGMTAETTFVPSEQQDFPGAESEVALQSPTLPNESAFRVLDDAENSELVAMGSPSLGVLPYCLTPELTGLPETAAALLNQACVTDMQAEPDRAALPSPPDENYPPTLTGKAEDEKAVEQHCVMSPDMVGQPLSDTLGLQNVVSTDGQEVALNAIHKSEVQLGDQDNVIEPLVLDHYRPEDLAVPGIEGSEINMRSQSPYTMSSSVTRESSTLKISDICVTEAAGGCEVTLEFRANIKQDIPGEGGTITETYQLDENQQRDLQPMDTHQEMVLISDWPTECQGMLNNTIHLDTAGLSFVNSTYSRVMRGRIENIDHPQTIRGTAPNIEDVCREVAKQTAQKLLISVQQYYRKEDLTEAQEGLPEILRSPSFSGLLGSIFDQVGGTVFNEVSAKTAEEQPEESKIFDYSLIIRSVLKLPSASYSAEEIEKEAVLPSSNAADQTTQPEPSSVADKEETHQQTPLASSPGENLLPVKQIFSQDSHREAQPVQISGWPTSPTVEQPANEQVYDESEWSHSMYQHHCRYRHRHSGRPGSAINHYHGYTKDEPRGNESEQPDLDKVKSKNEKSHNFLGAESCRCSHFCLGSTGAGRMNRRFRENMCCPRGPCCHLPGRATSMDGKRIDKLEQKKSGTDSHEDNTSPTQSYSEASEMQHITLNLLNTLTKTAEMLRCQYNQKKRRPRKEKGKAETAKLDENVQNASCAVQCTNVPLTLSVGHQKRMGKLMRAYCRRQRTRKWLLHRLILNYYTSPKGQRCAFRLGNSRFLISKKTAQCEQTFHINSSKSVEALASDSKTCQSGSDSTGYPETDVQREAVHEQTSLQCFDRASPCDLLTPSTANLSHYHADDMTTNAVNVPRLEACLQSRMKNFEVFEGKQEQQMTNEASLVQYLGGMNLVQGDCLQDARKAILKVFCVNCSQVYTDAFCEIHRLTESQISTSYDNQDELTLKEQDKIEVMQKEQQKKSKGSAGLKRLLKGQFESITHKPSPKKCRNSYSGKVPTLTKNVSSQKIHLPVTSARNVDKKPPVQIAKVFRKIVDTSSIQKPGVRQVPNKTTLPATTSEGKETPKNKTNITNHQLRGKKVQ